MQQTNPPSDGERWDDPYQPPQVKTNPATEQKENDQAERQRNLHLLRESSIRLTGLLGMIMAVCAALLFTLYVYDLFYHPDVFDKNGSAPLTAPPWFLPTSFFLLLMIEGATSWGIYRLRNWGRWGLTIVTSFPVLIILCGWFLLKIVGNQAIRKLIDQVSLSIYFVISGLCCTLLLFLMWSSEGRTVFSPGYCEIMRQTPRLRPGCSGIGLAFLAGLAEFISYILFFLSVLSALVMLGLIQPK